jgi:putative ABC transport system permease protein
LRGALVVGEIALSLVLLTGAGLMLRSFDKLMKVDPGFQAERVLTLRVPVPTNLKERPQQSAYYTRLIEKMQGMPGVNSAGLVVPLPLAEVDANGTLFIPGRGWTEPQLVKMRVASAGYFRSMAIAVKQGRVFDERDGDGAPGAVVVNETFARKFFPNENPVGRLIGGSRDGQSAQQIIGIVADVKATQLGAPHDPEMYRDYRQYIFAGFGMTLTLRTASPDPQALAAAAQREVRSVNPDQPVGDVRTMLKVLNDNVSQPRFYTLLLSIFAALALALAAIGLYGVLSFSVSRRAHEIGIRMALGARSGSIFGLVLKEALLLVGAGVALGLGGAAALTRLMKAQLYETAPLDATTFVAVAMVMFAVAVAAACVPARRAVAMNPVETIWGR